MSTYDMKQIVQAVKAETGQDIVCDYFDSAGNMEGTCDGEHFDCVVPVVTKKYRPDAKNQPDVYETMVVFDVEGGIKALKEATKKKVTRAPAKKKATVKAAPVETADEPAVV